MLLTALLVSAALAAPAPYYAVPVIEVHFAGAPEDFAMTDLHTEWQWRDKTPDLGPTAVVHIELDLRVPKTWALKKLKSGLAKLIELKPTPKLPGIWHLVAEQNTATASAEIEFVDERNKVHKLDLTTLSKSRRPYLLIKEQCEDYRVRLEPGIEHGHYLYLVVTCHEFGDDIILYFARSPDARWVGSNILKKPKELSFEHKFPKKFETADDEPLLSERHVFDLHTEDLQGRRTDYGIFISDDDW